MDETIAQLEALIPPLSALRRPAAEDIADDVAFTYDVPTDTLFVDLFGVGMPATSVPIEVDDRDVFYARVDPARRLIVGFQIEDFLSYAAVRKPALLDALAFARITGTSTEEESRIREAASDQIPARHHTTKMRVVADLERLIA
jgi:hypothetical protein